MKYDEAVQAYKKAVELDEFNARFYVNFAICFYEKTEFDSAIKERGKERRITKKFIENLKKEKYK